MRVFKFEKYHNLGNDFIIIDDEEKKIEKYFSKKKAVIKNLCQRNFGIGADGLVFIQKEKSLYRMKIYNSDGSSALSCGNALLCITKFLHKKTKKKEFFIKTEKDVVFTRYDKKSVIKMTLPKIIEKKTILSFNGTFVFSGTFHFVIFKKEMPKDISVIGKKIREHKYFLPTGTNVCFAVKNSKGIFVRVFEKGVEKETNACGTGALACCYVLKQKNLKQKKIKVYFKKGNMEVFFDEKAYLFSSPKFIYEGVFKAKLC